MRTLFLSLILMVAACDPVGTGPGRAGWDTVIIRTETGLHRFTVEIADDDEEQRRGLMYRRHLDDDAGMLFLYDRERLLSYWMRNTYVSLDIIYIDEDGRIVSIAEHTTPLSEASIPSGAPAIAVLEVVAGTSERLGIEPGDEVQHPFFAERRRGN